MLKYLDRRIFNYTYGSHEMRAAVALAIWVKQHTPCGVFKDWSYRKVAAEVGISPTTLTKRIATLRRLHLARFERHNGHSYLVFKTIRRRKIKNKKNDRYHTPHHLDIDISNLYGLGVKEIEKALMATLITEVTRRKEWLKQRIKFGTNPNPGTSTRKVNAARRFCRVHGFTRFVDNGFSYRGIGKRLHCSPNTVKKIIEVGESLGMYICQRLDLVYVKYIGRNQAKFALPFYKTEYPNAFATLNNIYYRPSLIFTLT